MAYVEWHDTMRNHPKTDALMLFLGIRRREAVGIIGCLSSWAIQYRPGGVIERDYIAVAIEWEGDSEKLVRELLHAHWLDEIDSEMVAIHDWKDITRGYRKARADATRKRRKRRETLHGQSTDSPRTVHGTARENSRTAPRSDLNDLNRTEQNERIHPPARAETDSLAAKQNQPTPKSGTSASEIASAYCRTNPGVIAQEKATHLVEFSLARGVEAAPAHAAVMSPDARGKKLWEILDPLAPKTAKDGFSYDEIEKWAAEETRKEQERERQADTGFDGQEPA